MGGPISRGKSERGIGAWAGGILTTKTTKDTKGRRRDCGLAAHKGSLYIRRLLGILLLKFRVPGISVVPTCDLRHVAYTGGYGDAVNPAMTQNMLGSTYIVWNGSTLREYRWDGRQHDCSVTIDFHLISVSEFANSA